MGSRDWHVPRLCKLSGSKSKRYEIHLFSILTQLINYSSTIFSSIFIFILLFYHFDKYALIYANRLMRYNGINVLFCFQARPRVFVFYFYRLIVAFKDTLPQADNSLSYQDVEGGVHCVSAHTRTHTPFHSYNLGNWMPTLWCGRTPDTCSIYIELPRKLWSLDQLMPNTGFFVIAFTLFPSADGLSFIPSFYLPESKLHAALCFKEINFISVT